MNNSKIKINRYSGSRFIKSYSTCLKRSPEYSKGFTLVETMFAVFILTFTIVGLMTVVANSLFAARYARDEITANYLLQEVIDYVRNDRDTTVFLSSGSGMTSQNWETFYGTYSNCGESNGCYFDVLNPNGLVNIKQCPSSGCPFLYYDETADNTPFYVNYDDSDMNGMLKTNFQRKVVVLKDAINSNEIKVTTTVSWKNGGLIKSRLLETSLLNWQQ